EEYLDSEKYQVRQRHLDGPLLPLVADLNRIRRSHAPLQHLGPVVFLETRNDQLLAFAKQREGQTVLTIVNLDPHEAQTGSVWVPDELGLGEHFGVHDLLGGGRYDWHRGDNFVRLEPGLQPAHIFEVAS
ncbi:MAG: hypothetical protein JWO77_2565, partial [Ilumatobacteraceae bacterium]|nr:hypothetical protein [Ilumatobacteraceae bacterium]